ncbi:hypothetical protein BaRGS_00012253 [Batillaria attramentaria]|uniref:Cadherin domain-containing protein n=1 Tax=Batillaria attramentaria TaxID=370345 RepID=A0ABD0LAL0_9CAEN
MLFTTTRVRGQDISLLYALQEEQAAGVFVGDVAQDSNIQNLGSEQELRDLTFRFLGEGGDAASNFRIDSSSGVLTTGVVLDRETLCRFQIECRLSFRLAAQSTLGLFFKIIDVAVMVNDVNDNSPIFTPDVTELTIMEDADFGDVFPLPNAIDADTGANNSVQYYSLLASDAPFSLQFQGTSLDAGLWLRLTGALDRETVNSYRLLVVATDGGQPVRTGTLTINVQVGDVNDHGPTWEQAQYTVNVSEIAALNTVVMTLVAYDADSGNNGLVTYRFTPLQPASALGLFALNGTTGELSVAKPLDDYAGQTYTLEVEARDSGSPFKSSRTDVIIRVLDTHNSRPEIILSVFGEGTVAELSEFSDLGRVVAHIALRDPDSGLNGIVQCSEEAEHFQLQAMAVGQYKVILSKPLDRESRDHHVVNITCQDAGNPPLAATKSFTVKVLDENDHTPVFTQSMFQARINESAAGSNDRDVYVTMVTATDADEGENSRLGYRVIDDPRNEFRVDGNGTVFAVRGLDRETGGSQRYLRIIAFDHGAIANTATSTIFLTVNDVNDNAPEFTDPHPVFFVSEGAPLTSFVGNVSAKDDDAEENAIVLFRIHPNDEGRVPFKVITDGVIKTEAILDRETRERYTDVNNTVHVPHTLSPNTIVTSVKAVDRDAGRNRMLVYSRDSRNGTRFFDVMPENGQVILMRALSERDVGEHVMTVVAHDQGYPTQLANQTLLYIQVYRGNYSAISGDDDDETFRNTLLVVIIVAVTIVLSVAVVVTMVLMRHNDRQRRLYRAKEEEAKVDASLKELTHHHIALSQECSGSSAGSDVSATSSDRRRKEVSFSLDEDNNITPGSAAMMFEKVAADSFDPIPEMTPNQVEAITVVGYACYRDNGNTVASCKHSDLNTLVGILRTQHKLRHIRHERQRCLLEPRGQDDNMSEVSCDVSTSDSGRGGSDVEMHSHGGASKESDWCLKTSVLHLLIAIAFRNSSDGLGIAEQLSLGGDNSFGSQRGMQSAHPLDVRSKHPHQRSVTFDLCPTTFSPRGSGRLTTFPVGNSYSDNTDSRNLVTFSSFSPVARYDAPSQSLSPSTSSSLTSSRRQKPASARQSRDSRDFDRDSYPHPQPASSRYGEGEEGSYVDLQSHSRRPRADGDYMDMSGATYNASQHSTTTTGTWDGDTTTSGSYTVDPHELAQEIDKLFFDQPKDVVV